MRDITLIQEKIDTLRRRALDTLEEFISLPTTDEMGCVIRENAGPKLMATKIILSAAPIVVQESFDKPIPILSRIDQDAIDKALNELV